MSVVVDHCDEVFLRPARAGDEPAWRQLWHEYCGFYEQEVDEETTAATWRRILSNEDTFRCVVACRGERLVGFAVVILHASSWSAAPACCLEDLFVAPDSRGQGVARALILHLVEQGKTAGWSRLYWMTRADNAAARRVYDRFARADGFVRYRLDLHPTR